MRNVVVHRFVVCPELEDEYGCECVHVDIATCIGCDHFVDVREGQYTFVRCAYLDGDVKK